MDSRKVESCAYLGLLRTPTQSICRGAHEARSEYINFQLLTSQTDDCVADNQRSLE
jgi:hypothetical protein